MIQLEKKKKATKREKSHPFPWSRSTHPERIGRFFEREATIRGQPPRISPLAASICPFIAADRSRPESRRRFCLGLKGPFIRANTSPRSPCARFHLQTPPIQPFPDFLPFLVSLPISFASLLLLPCLPCFHRLPIIACDLYNGQPPLTMLRSCLLAVYSNRRACSSCFPWMERG